MQVFLFFEYNRPSDVGQFFTYWSNQTEVIIKDDIIFLWRGGGGGGGQTV